MPGRTATAASSGVFLALVALAGRALAADTPAGPSAGCGKANPPTGELTIDSQGGKRPYLVLLPPGYDAKKAYPLGFAFHGFQRTHVDCRDEDCTGFKEVVGAQAIVVFPKSIGQGWEDRDPGTIEQNGRMFVDLLDHLEQSYCVDRRRVFVAGTSSGAGFAYHLGCKLGDRLLAIAPVHGGLRDRGRCAAGHPAVLAIHGIEDKLIPRAIGEEARQFFVARNGCTRPPQPPLATVHARVKKARKAGQTAWGCADYPGCQAAPVRWCVHSEGGYENLNHGWPSQGGQVIWDFVAKLAP